MKICLVHDDFCQIGGAENLFATIAALFPDAPIYTSLVDWNKIPASINKDRIKTSFMQKIPFARKFFKILLPLYPLAFETFNFDDYDLVISSTTRFAKSIITKPKTVHICYINSVPRFLWKEDQKDYLPSWLHFASKPILDWLKRYDKASASRVDYYIANSQNVKNQLDKVYAVYAEVVYPFVDSDFFKPTKVHNWYLKSQEYFLVVSRLVQWKKIEIAIRACCELGKNLIIVGEGPDKARLESLATSFLRPASRAKQGGPVTPVQIQFLNKVSLDQLRQLYQNCRALIVTQEEDFGVAAVEAQACGRPVIAYSKGGTREILKSSQTGILFKNQTVYDLKDAINASLKVKWTESAARKNILRFSKTEFIKALKAKIEQYASKSQRS